MLEQQGEHMVGNGPQPPSHHTHEFTAMGYKSKQKLKLKLKLCLENRGE